MSKPTKVKHQYNAFVVLYSGISSIVNTEVLIFEPFSEESEEATSKRVKINATWDTGATNTCVRQSVIDGLGLIPSGVTNIQTAGGTTSTNSYLVNVVLPNHVGIKGVMVSGLPELANTDCLIGMDIISRGDFSITNLHGQTCLSFRIPSIERVDYVYEYNKQIFGNVKPYEPCPCGSKDSLGRQKTFRNCHMPMFHPINNGDKVDFFPE